RPYHPGRASSRGCNRGCTLIAEPIKQKHFTHPRECHSKASPLSRQDTTVVGQQTKRANARVMVMIVLAIASLSYVTLIPQRIIKRYIWLRDSPAARAAWLNFPPCTRKSSVR